MGRGDRDPVEWAAEADRDLQEISTWEPRTALDRFSTEVYRMLLAGGRAAVIGLAIAVLAGQFLATAIITLEDPIVALYIALSIVPAFFLVVFLWRMDVVRYEPIETLAITFLLGVLFAGFAAIFNTALKELFVGLGAVGIVLYFFLVVGPIEETVKLFAVRIHAYRVEHFDAVIDGAIYGAMAGLGFAAIENMLYITREYLQAVGTSSPEFLNPTAQIAAVRTFAGPGHVIYSAFAGYYLGLAKFNPGKRGPIVIKGLLIAAGIHATYNTLVSNLGLVMGFVPFLGDLPPGVAFVAFVFVFDGFFFALLYAKLERYRRAFDAVGAGKFYEEQTE